MRRLASLLFLGAVLSIALSSQGVNRLQELSTKYSTEPFDTTVSSLPPNFAGNDPEAVYEALRAKWGNVQKGEFESTAEYEQRLQQASANPLVMGNLELGSTYSFRVAPSQIQAQYDADAKLLAVTIRFNMVGSTGIKNDSGRQALALGTVDHTPWGFYAAVSNRRGNLSTIVEVPLSAQEAMKIKPNVAGLIVVGLKQAAPFISTEIRAYILCQMKDLWLFDQHDGKILFKLSAPQR